MSLFEDLKAIWLRDEVRVAKGRGRVYEKRPDMAVKQKFKATLRPTAIIKADGTRIPYEEYLKQQEEINNG